MVFHQILRALATKLNFIPKFVLSVKKIKFPSTCTFRDKICLSSLKNVKILKKISKLFSAKIKFQQQVLCFMAKNSSPLLIYHLFQFFFLSFLYFYSFVLSSLNIHFLFSNLVSASFCFIFNMVQFCFLFLLT